MKGKDNWGKRRNFWRTHRTKNKKSQVSGNGHGVFRNWDSIAVHEGLHRGIYHIICSKTTALFSLFGLGFHSDL